MDSQTQTLSKTGSRKKFSVPPVKLACLACRASRVRCDGQEICSGCRSRGRECIYVQSRRGGARVPRNKRQVSRTAEDPKAAEGFFDEAVPPMVNPGAGLTQLDRLLEDAEDLINGVSVPVSSPAASNQGTSSTQSHGFRDYRSDGDILDAYYIWLHPFFPILPPPRKPDLKDNPNFSYPGSTTLHDSNPSSPIGLAISAILALIPHPNDHDPTHSDGVKMRRNAAHAFAKRTLDKIESDSEMPDSAVSPSAALTHGLPSISRAPFHPDVPIELESVIALCILSVYEYAQRGNMAKMRDRASQALVSAMNMSLHERSTDDDAFAEAKRRTWWTTYVCVCQAYIVSCTPPTVCMFDDRFTASFPTLAADPEAWPFFIKSQQTILLATQFVADVGRAVDGKIDWSAISAKMQELHSKIEPLVAQSESWSRSQSSAYLDDRESIVAFSLKQMSRIKLNSARIKLHRYCAFFDIPVFSEKHCDLKKSTPITGDELDQASLGSPCCNNGLPTDIALPSNPTSPRSFELSTPSTPFVPDEFIHPFPFSSHESSRLCLKSALSIAEAFGAMPLPMSTVTAEALTVSGLSPPRTMPSFACCAMQSAYALLMVYHKTWVTDQASESALALLNQCESGLKSVLAALTNYSIAFEALGGMRDQVQAALDCLSLSD